MIHTLKTDKVMRRLLLAGLTVVLVAGCKNFLNVNQNPNESTNPSLSGLLSDAEYMTAQNSYDAAGVTTYYVQQLASPSGSSIDRQNVVYLDGTWSSLYSTMTDLKDLDTLAVQKGATEYAAISKILLAMNLGETTDLWGDIPYSKAFLGQADLTPAYDSQKDIYADIQKLLDDAISELKSGPSATATQPASDDYYYAGDTQKWLETAYALKARYLNHLSKKTSYDPQAVLRAVSNAYQSNADDAQLTYTSANRNPWATVVLNNTTGTLGGFISQYLIQAMADSAQLADSTAHSIYGVYDPRLSVITDTLAGGQYNGTVNGKGSPKSYNYITSDSWFAQDSSPIQLVTYSEIKFIEAEAAFRMGDKATAYQAYLDGIKANMDKLGIPSAEETAYLTNPKVAVGANNLTLELIFKEKLVALFLQPEAWTDARRFDYQYKDMTVPYMQYSALNGKFIRRILYPQSEQSRNAKNMPSVTLTTHMWWDQTGQ
ncbi:MAG TPA: SusD/RagB family nutrient-binding outer membrane lipoprotein [Balneolales bacterium]|nr:SusD/RagB family nutrient-binding outer membrane lipoprotein [Balneolales bacterium]